MLMFLYVGKNSGFFAKLIEAAEGSFKRLVVTNYYSSQRDSPPLERLWCASVIFITIGKLLHFLTLSMGKCKILFPDVFLSILR